MTIASETENRHRRHLAMAMLVTALALAPWTLPLGMGSAVAQTAAPAPGSTVTSATNAKGNKPPSAGQTAMRERQKKCATEWKQAKAGGKLEKGMKWPQFWSACNKRLKSAA